jgi:hypothetical protein
LVRRQAATRARIAVLPSLLLVSLAGCSQDREEQAAECSSVSSRVYSILVLDDQNPRGDVARLDVEFKGWDVETTPYAVEGLAVEPFDGETVFRFPYRVAPVVTVEDLGSVSVTARNSALEVVSTGTTTLPSTDFGDKSVALAFLQIEID